MSNEPMIPNMNMFHWKPTQVTVCMRIVFLTFVLICDVAGDDGIQLCFPPNIKHSGE